jgi:hypothetical protein
MAQQPGAQGLHAAEVRNLDEFGICGLRVHKATPEDRVTTVLAETGDDRSLYLQAADAGGKAGFRLSAISGSHRGYSGRSCRRL